MTWQFVHCTICQHISQAIHKRFQAVRYFKVKISTHSNRAKIGVCFGVKYLIFLVPQWRHITALPSRYHQLSFYSDAHICYCVGSVFPYWSVTFMRFLLFLRLFFHKAPFTKPLINYQYCGLCCYVTLYLGKGLPNFVKKLTVQSLWRTKGAVVLCSCETSSFIQTTQSDISEDHNTNPHTRENLKFRNWFSIELSVEGQWSLLSHNSLTVIMLLKAQSSHYCCSFDGTGHLLLFYYIVPTVVSCSFEWTVKSKRGFGRKS